MSPRLERIIEEPKYRLVHVAHVSLYTLWLLVLGQGGAEPSEEESEV